MTSNQIDNQIRKAVAKIIPEIISKRNSVEVENRRKVIKENRWFNRPIQLADILRAIENKNEVNYYENAHNLLVYWDLSKSYEDQKDEVKEFIYKLIFK